jgi:hypothetical protein
MIDWTIEAFNPKKNPWFRDEFIHPAELAKGIHAIGPAMIDVAFGTADIP